MRTRRLLPICSAAALLLPALAGTAVGMSEGSGSSMAASSSEGASLLAFPGGGTFHSTTNPVLNSRLIHVPGTTTVLALWEEQMADGSTQPFYAVSFDGRNLAGRVRQTDYTINLRYAKFDPRRVVPAVAPELRAPQDNTVHLVQFWTVPLEDFRTQITDLGGEIVRFAANHTYVIRMDEQVRQQVEQLPYVRWTGPFHPAYKLDGQILGGLVTGMPETLQTYSIEVFARGADEQDAVGAALTAMGGQVMNTTPPGFRMTVWMTPSQIVEIARRNDVNFIDPWGPGELDTHLARLLNGAEPAVWGAGFKGEGVRGEIFDSGLTNPPHPDWGNVLYSLPGVSGNHGNQVAGIPFGDGSLRSGDPDYQGFMPERELVVAAFYNGVTQFNPGAPKTRHEHTEEIVDPSGPYRVVLQTASVGSPRTCQYTTISAEVDDYLWLYRLLSTQSQSNANLTCDSRPQAWAKNIVGVGGISRESPRGLATTLDRRGHTASGSTGPAADGRIQPSLSHFYSQIRTTSGSNSYTDGFGGTSGATPLTVGNFGLFFQMWHEGVFDGHGGAATVFESRPSFMTAKAALVNTAYRYDWYSAGASSRNRNMWRDRQGWGMADIGTLYEMRDKIMFIDEEEEIGPLQTIQHEFVVDIGEPALNVTLSYADPAGNPAASIHRINDLSLRVTSPSGVAYWGNNSLRDSNFSAPGGNSNTVDTVENVFIENPEAGVWLFEVIADEVVAPGIPGNPNLVANYSLVASGGTEVRGVTMRLSAAVPSFVPPGEPTDFEVIITEGSSTMVPGSAEFHYRLSGGSFTTVKLESLGGDLWGATLPAAGCEDEPEFYFSVEDANAGLKTLPGNAPANVLSMDVGTLQTTVELDADFESGIPAGWSATGLWHVSSSCGPTQPCGNSTQWAYFGQSGRCDYHTTRQVTGDLTAPQISLPPVPPGGSITLTYCSNRETESNAQFDVAEVYVNNILVDEPEQSEEWQVREIDLAQFAGEQITIRFHFDSKDGINNTYRGWQVDNVKVEVTALGCDDCYADCNGDGVLDSIDFMCFQNRFLANDPYADCNGDGVLDFFDFLCFQNEFLAGCP